ncbi:MAG: PepSY-associated TM helix domain-containing protein [Pseudomonadota bacterium]
MEQQRHKRLYGLHEWTGNLFGLFLFVVSFTGTVALFYDEFTFWEATELRSAAYAGEYIAPESLVDAHLASYPEGTTFANLFLRLPSETAGYYELFGRHTAPAADGEAASKPEDINVRWHAATGAELNDRGDGLAHWLVDIHRHLMLPNRTIGRFLVGIAGLVMLVSIITGIFTHQKILKELFTLRVGRSKRLQWKDTHNALGAWALPFHGMIAFSGAYLGLVVILLPVFAMVAFNGDQEAAIETVIGKPVEAAGVAASPYPISDAVQAVEESGGYRASGVRLDQYGDTNARYEVFLEIDDRLLLSSTVRVDGVTGEGADRAPMIIEGGGQENATVAEQVLNAMVALHYATYGGIWLKILYIGLGAALCIMVGTGLMVWVERRANGSIGNLSRQTYLRISRLNTGVMMGLLPATVLLFYVDRLVPVAADERLTVIGWTYLGTWIACTLLSTVIPNSRAFVRTVLIASGVLGIGVLPLDALTLGDASLLAPAQRTALGLDFGAVLLGLLALFVGLGLNRLYAPKVQRGGSLERAGATALPQS